MRKGSIEHAMTAVCIAGLAYSIVTVSGFLLERSQEASAENKMHEEIESYLNLSSDKDQNEEETPGFTPEAFRALKEQYPDFTCWLEFDDGWIEEPVMSSWDNYYLDHWLDGSMNSQGTVYMETGSSPEDDVQVMYGHCVTYDSSARFTPLLDLSDQREYDRHHEFSVRYESGMVNYIITAVCRYDVYEDTFSITADDFSDEEAYAAYTDWYMQRNLIEPCEVPEYGDHLLVLVTCNGWIEDERVVVLCKMLDYEENGKD